MKQYPLACALIHASASTFSAASGFANDDLTAKIQLLNPKPRAFYSVIPTTVVKDDYFIYESFDASEGIAYVVLFIP